MDQQHPSGHYYQNVIKYTNDVIVNTKTITARSNLYNMARIFQAYAFMILTDEYGDIPYTEAGAGYTDQIFFPKYDAQSGYLSKTYTGIYRASAALNPAGAIETQMYYMRAISPNGKNLAIHCC